MNECDNKIKEEIIPKDNSEKIILPLIGVWFILIINIISLKDYVFQMEKPFIIFSIIRIFLYLICAILMTKSFETKKLCYYIFSMILSIILNLSFTFYCIYLIINDSKIKEEDEYFYVFLVMIALEWALIIILIIYLFKVKKGFIKNRYKGWAV